MSSTYRNIWSTASYIFQATSSGINIYDVDTEVLSHIINYTTGINSVWSNDDYLFMATTNSGVWNIPVSTISGSYDLSNQISLYKNYPSITNSYVNYIHGAGDYLCITTLSGVDHINMITSSGICTTVSDTTKCYQTSDGRFYYILSKTPTDWVYRKLITLPSATSMSDQPVKIELTPSNFNYSKAHISGKDIRFKDINLNQLDYFIAVWSYGGTSTLWANIPDIGTNSIYLFYGNQDAVDESDVSAVFDFYDDCSGVFADKWESTCGYAASCYYSNEELYFDRGSQYRSGVNALTKKAFTCSGINTIEFKWMPWTGTWWDDDFTDAMNTVDLVQTSPLYAGGIYNYSRCEYGVGKDSKLMLCLRTSKPVVAGPPSEKITIQERVNGSTLAVLNESFVYDLEHQVKWIIDFDNYWTELYMDDVQIGSRETWDSTLFNTHVGTECKINFHWHNYGSSADMIQKYDNIAVQKYSPELVSVFGTEELVRDFKDKLIAVYDNTQSWTISGYSYEVDAGIILMDPVDDTFVKDLYITEGTSKYQSTDNVIFLATSYGVVVIEERKDDEVNSRVKYYFLE